MRCDTGTRGNESKFVVPWGMYSLYFHGENVVGRRFFWERVGFVQNFLEMALHRQLRMRGINGHPCLDLLSWLRISKAGNCQESVSKR